MSFSAREAARQKRAATPGDVPDHRIPIVDHKGRLRGRVGPQATEVTVARFTGQHGAELKKVDGRKTWVSPPPPPKPKPRPAAKAAGAGGGSGEGASKGSPSHTLEISLKAAKGSASKAAGKK